MGINLAFLVASGMSGIAGIVIAPVLAGAKGFPYAIPQRVIFTRFSEEVF